MRKIGAFLFSIVLCCVVTTCCPFSKSSGGSNFSEYYNCTHSVLENTISEESQTEVKMIPFPADAFPNGVDDIG